MNRKQTKTGITDILLLVISAVFLIGINTFFSPCAPKEDGSWMTCHWAGQSVLGIAAVLLVISALHLVVKDGGVKRGLSLAMIPLALLAAILPGNLIDLCMMNTMRCHTLTRTCSIIFAALTILAAVVDAVVQSRRSKARR